MYLNEYIGSPLFSVATRTDLPSMTSPVVRSVVTGGEGATTIEVVGITSLVGWISTETDFGGDEKGRINKANEKMNPKSRAKSDCTDYRKSFAYWPEIQPS